MSHFSSFEREAVGNTDTHLSGEIVSEHCWHSLSMFELYPSLIVPIVSVIGAIFAVVLLFDEHTVRSIAIISAIFVLAPIWMAYLYYRSRSELTKIVLRTDGVEWEGGPTTGNGSRPWADVKEVIRVEVSGATHIPRTTTITFHDSVTLTLDKRLLKYKKLCDTVQELSTPFILAAKLEEVRATGATFGNVVVFPQGLEFLVFPGGEVRPSRVWEWESLGDWRIVNGYFRITERKGGSLLWTEVNFEIPNFLVFCIMLEMLWKKSLPPKQFPGLLGGPLD